MIHAAISQLSAANVLARIPLMLFLFVTGTAGNVGGLSTVVDWVKHNNRMRVVDRVVATHVLNSRTVYASPADWQGLPGVMPTSIDEETLWLARCIFSETKDPTEMELVAWVVRNRVETGYRGRTTYRSVVLDPLQFSAFNPSSSARYFYSNLKPSSPVAGWKTALRIAYSVRTAKHTMRPFSVETRHFFSRRSMVGYRFPTWAGGQTPVVLNEFEIDADRFRFYEGVS